MVYYLYILSYLEIVNFPLLLSQILSLVQWIILCSTFWHWHKPVWLWTDGHFILEILTQFSFWQTSPTYSYRRTWYNIMVTGSMLSLGNEKNCKADAFTSGGKEKFQIQILHQDVAKTAIAFILNQVLGK